MTRFEENSPECQDSCISMVSHLICAFFSGALSCMLRLFTLASSLFLICTVCAFVRGHIISFFFWLGFLSVKSLSYSMMFIYFLSALTCNGHNIRAVPGLLFWGQHKSLDLNSINFCNTGYTDWIAILNQILKASDTVRYFVK